MKIYQTNPKPTVEIVISRYNEDISWIDTLPKVKITVYNKGNYTNNSIPLPNIGREGHTYYHHIVNNYNKLADYTVFLQGHPFDHSPDILEQLKHTDNLKVDFRTFGTTLETTLEKDKYYQGGLPSSAIFKNMFPDRKPFTQPFKFVAGAQFVVSKKLIHNHPKEFYQKIVDLLAYDSNPVEGHVIERFHGLIFVENPRKPFPP